MSWQVKQRINFYTDEFRPPQLPDDIARLLWSFAANAAVVLLLTLLVGVYAVWQNKNLSTAESRHSYLQQQLEQVRASRPPLLEDSALKLAKENAEQQLKTSRGILRYLTQGHLEKSQSFTAMVEQLGDQDVKGVWLQSFVISDQGQRINLAGYVDDPAKLSPYISTLVKRDAYKNKAFRFIDIQKNETNSWLKFELDTRQPEKEQQSELLTRMAARANQ